MQNQEEIAKINHFLSAILPVIVRSMKTFLQTAGLEVEEKGCGLDTAFLIKAGEKETEFYLHNLFLEIATIDRDEIPLRFDEKLQDFDYFAAKSAKLIDSKLRILFELLSQDDVDKVIDNISQQAKDYQRVRIWRFDQEPL
ncbi:MAG: hypothetical protein ABSE89_11330 [Sedimentisphaerales bacterium]